MKTLVVLLGPTGVGKTELSLSLAEMLGSPVLNCDSRQLFRDIRIGTAAPTEEELRRAKHYFVATLPIDAYYSAAQYESDVLKLTSELFKTHDTLLLSGGSMMYIDAVCQGIDDIPTISKEVRAKVKTELAEKGLPALVEDLQRLDPEYHAIVDPQNTRRVVHALEVCMMSGQTYTAFRTRKHKPRPFHIVKIGLNRPREELFQRINARVDKMMQDGLLNEVRRMLPYRDCNALNTVGYKELLHVIDGDWPLDMAVERIKKNTRVYAKKQLTWFRRDAQITWFHPDDIDLIKRLINQTIQ
ncbi:MAG: tRNA (adenosine(37)-N6)-dimethylallyltransferase MiaA [Bacteroidaceae bacterium]|nr:tRNA (adenosine(37)-N6)-dimethylallyltransferase MiaA [Bacteroidaceae bacterium]